MEGSPFSIFYDDEHRLTRYIQAYSRDSGDYYSKHSYVYENGLVVRDTSEGSVSGHATIVQYLEYDTEGRVIKETGHFIEVDHNPWYEETDPIIYSYDTSGNLNSETVVYDDKMNFRRTNEVWMFTQRNYSVNNAVGAGSYNEAGLPLTFEEARRPYFLVYGVSSIEYECSGN